MRSQALAVVLLLALPALARDGGSAASSDAGTRRAPRASDGGAPRADAGTAAAKSARASWVLAKDNPTLDRWAKTKPEGRAALGPLKGMKIGERAFLGIFVDGYEIPASRRVTLSADVTITDCTGRAVYEKAMAAGTRTMDPRFDVAVPLLPSVELLFGLTDPECEYKVLVTVFDEVRGNSLRAEGSFPVTR